MRGLPLRNIRLTDPFWSRWQKTLVEKTLPSEFEQIVETGRLANFTRVAAGESGGFEGYYFNDSDTYKWLEACAYALAARPDLDASRVRTQMEEAISAIQSAQEPSGYINTFFQLNHPGLKWRNLNSLHEMYCGGHLIEAGVALFECLGDRRMLDVSIRFADHVAELFGPNARRGYCGHQEIELALVRLSRATGDDRYADLARWMVEERGKRPSPFEAELKDPEALALQPAARHMLADGDSYRGDYCQDHVPIREQTEVVGHAVRAMYFYIAAALLSDGKGDTALEQALERIWANLTERRMYVTGGIGPSASNEGFTRDFDLPNHSAYAETCASIGLVFWAHTMLELTGDTEYADVMERALYNGCLSGISLSGDKFFYTNPLESRGTHQRVPWFSCACCPPNIARLIGNLAHYVAGAGDQEFYLHLPVGIDAEVTLGGVKTRITCTSELPWSGKVRITVSPEKPASFKLAVRVPGWCANVDSELAGASEEAGYELGYMIFDRTWKEGDVLELDFEMEPTWVEADPRVRDDLGRVALTYGPLVYCCEEIDAGYAPQLLSVDADAPLEGTWAIELEGVVAIEVEGMAEVELFPQGLYAEVGSTDLQPAKARFIPYFAWNNRGAGNMQVWFRRL